LLQQGYMSPLGVTFKCSHGNIQNTLLSFNKNDLSIYILTYASNKLAISGKVFSKS
jgi:hypothetical protein